MKKNHARRTFLKQSGLGGLGLLIPGGLLADESRRERRFGRRRKRLEHGRQLLHRIITVGDVHWCDDTTTKHPRLGKWANDIKYPDRFDKLIPSLNKEAATRGVDCFVFNGDIVTNCPEQLPTVKRIFEKLGSAYYVVHGNHDHCNDERWKELWGYNRNHSYTIGDYAVILLNSASEKGDYQCADSKWLEAQLKQYSDKKGVFVFCHIYQHDSGEFLFASVDCPKTTEVMAASENLKMAVYSHNHLQDGYYSINHNGRQLKTFFTGHYAAWGLPYLGYRVIEIFSDGGIETYIYDQENENVLNFNTVCMGQGAMNPVHRKMPTGCDVICE